MNKPLRIVLFCQFGNLSLPGEAFASSYEENEGLLNLATSVSGLLKRLLLEARLNSQLLVLIRL